MQGLSVFQMVHSVIGETKEKMAQANASTSGAKTKTAAVQAPRSPATGGNQSFSAEQLSKLAEACDFLADNVHEINDARSPQEKLAEYGAIRAALTKRAAFSVGHEAPAEPSLAGYTENAEKGEHQHEEAPSDSQSPKDPPMDDGAPNPGGPGTAMQATPAMTTGTSPVGGP